MAAATDARLLPSWGALCQDARDYLIAEIEAKRAELRVAKLKAKLMARVSGKAERRRHLQEVINLCVLDDSWVALLTLAESVHSGPMVLERVA